MSEHDESCLAHLKHLRDSWDSVGDDHRNYLRKIRDDFDFSPGVIYDVGACVTGWTTSARGVWPDSRYILFEAMEESAALFAESGFDYHIGVLGDQDGKSVTFYKNVGCPAGNSYYMENPEHSPAATQLFGNAANRFDRTMETLDSVCLRRQYPPPDLLKIDAQGCEIDILKGATNILRHVKHLIVEIQHVQYNIGALTASASVPIIETMGFNLVREKFALSSHADADYHFVNRSFIK